MPLYVVNHIRTFDAPCGRPSFLLCQRSVTAHTQASHTTRSLQIFRNGDTEKPAEYKGPRDAAGIVSYLTKKSQPASSLLSSAAEVILSLQCQSITLPR